MNKIWMSFKSHDGRPCQCKGEGKSVRTLIVIDLCISIRVWNNVIAKCNKYFLYAQLRVKFFRLVELSLEDTS